MIRKTIYSLIAFFAIAIASEASAQNCANGQCQNWQPTGQITYRRAPINWRAVWFPRLRELHRQRQIVQPMQVQQYTPPAYHVQPPTQYRMVPVR